MDELSPLTPADIAEVMRIERLPGYDAFVGRFEADLRRRPLAGPVPESFGLGVVIGPDGRGCRAVVTPVQSGHGSSAARDGRPEPARDGSDYIHTSKSPAVRDPIL